MSRFVLAAIAATLAMPAQAEWKAANPAVAEAVKNPRVAAALEAASRVDAAIVAGDKAGFIGAFAADAAVNSPNNVVTDRVAAGRAFDAGMIAYDYLRRSIEYVAPRGDSEVVMMGEEAIKPKAGPHAGKAVRRRFTDLWRLEDGEWKLSLRQATIFSVE